MLRKKRIKEFSQQLLPEVEIDSKPLLESVILEGIFMFVTEIDSSVSYYNHAALKNLHSCLLVNRQWCESTVRILWRRPFSPFHNGGHKLITTYLRSLDVEERRDLKLKGIKLPSASPIPLFNYPSLIRHLDYGEMLYSVEVWCRKLPKKRPDSVISIMRVLLRHFLHNAGPLSSLKLATLGEDYTDEKCMILTEPEIKGLITSVRTLSLDGFYYSEQGLLAKLPELCQNVEHLYLRGWYGHQPYKADTTSSMNDSAAISLRRLIKAQKNLKTFDMINCRAYLGYMISALDTQSITLRSMKFRLVDFKDCGPWEGLASCIKLKNLEFWFCKGITHKMIKPLLGKIFTELEEVKLLQYGIGCEEFNYWVNNINGISSTSNCNTCTVVDEYEPENTKLYC
ncbi:17414_t:CDS:2 [Dentiscutata heterogama]|uniref:17414_t:CDS:1 n=1 Tax=Dentiscutata heterogama TaxID=1316150 RepID=A0ACA9L405_9GLOM|nr:17414_t:CDS:2 [Dentiscutata heterogama]